MNDSSESIAVIRTGQTNSDVWYSDMAGSFILVITVIKLMAPTIEDMPAQCREKRLGEQKLQHGLDCCVEVGMLLNPFQHLLQLLMILAKVTVMVGVVRNIGYVYFLSRFNAWWRA